MVEIGRILKLFNKTNPSNVEKIWKGFMIKKKDFYFYSHNLFSEMYELTIFEQGNIVPLQKFVYNERNKEGDKKVEECYNLLHRKYFEWKKHEEEVMIFEAQEQIEKNKREEEMKDVLNEAERIQSFKKPEKILS